MRISDWSSDVCSSVLLHRDRDREMRDRVEEVRGAVERIDDEARLARIAFDLARLFHLEAPASTRVGQFVIQCALGRLIGFCYKVGRPFLRDLQMLDTAEIEAQLRAGLCGGALPDSVVSGSGHYKIPPPTHPTQLAG